MGGGGMPVSATSLIVVSSPSLNNYTSASNSQTASSKVSQLKTAAVHKFAAAAAASPEAGTEASSANEDREKRIESSISSVLAASHNHHHHHHQQQQQQQQQHLHHQHQREDANVLQPHALHASQHVPLVNLSAPMRQQGFEDLPENFLENSPSEQGIFSSIFPSVRGNTSPGSGPTLASLTPVSLIDLAGYHHGTANPEHSSVTQMTPLIPMTTVATGGSRVVSASPSAASTQPYVMTLKLEPSEIMSSPALGSSGGPASLLSPMQLVSTSAASSNELFTLPPVLVQQNGSLHYVKVELSDFANNFQSSGSAGSLKMVASTSSSTGSSVHSHPVVSTVDLANNLIATMLTGSEPVASTDSAVTHFVDMKPVQVQIAGYPPSSVSASAQAGASTLLSRKSGGTGPNQNRNNRSGGGGGGGGVRSSNNNNSSGNKMDLELEEDQEDDIYIDTKDLCKRIAYELKQHSIPQAIFAERILCRSQGTLSDLLRNPKPWNKLKSGRETFRRMYAWLKQPLPQRLALLELWKVGAKKPEFLDSDPLDMFGSEAFPNDGSAVPQDPFHQSGGGEGGTLLPSPLANSGIPPAAVVVREMSARSQSPTSADDDDDDDDEPSTPNERSGHRSSGGGGGGGGGSKRPRLVFTDIQKRTLQAIFKETQRPSKEMQQTIAEHLGLDLSTVQNFFMNARRRSRLGPQPDGPAPNQQIRAVTPPPRSPPPGHMTMTGRTSAKRRTSGSAAVVSPQQSAQHLARIESTVATVANNALVGSSPPKRQFIRAELSTGEPITVEVVALNPSAPTPPALLDPSVVIPSTSAGGATTTTYSGLQAILDPKPPRIVTIQSQQQQQQQQSNQTSSDKLQVRPPLITYERRSLPVMSLEPTVSVSRSEFGVNNSPPKKRLLLGYENDQQKLQMRNSENDKGKILKEETTGVSSVDARESE